MVKQAKQLLRSIPMAAFTLALVISTASAALAQYYDDGPGTTTLRTPLIPGAYNAPVGGQPVTPDLPPPGCGPTPYPVTPGMSGDPGPEPWVTNIPSNTAPWNINTAITLPLTPTDTTEPGQFNQYVGSSIPNEPSTPGTDPGMFYTKTGGNAPPAVLVPLNSDGSLPGDQAPQQKWGGQTTTDFGRNYWNGQDSQLYDFGQKLSVNPNVAKQPQESQNGPRPWQTATDYITPVRQPQLTNTYGAAQETTDPGYRQLSAATNQLPVQTQASY
jgi:hypothetical protein